jgi:hypothetical protein
MVTPSGGDKDESPPELRKSTPPLNTVYFNNDGFQLEFDELLVLDNINSQLIVSPPLAEKPEVKAMKKKLIVKFKKEDLLENTTYSFNFGFAIKDFNEGNVLTNFKYVFSTGSYIDSLALSGKVIDSFTEEPMANVAVLMYRSLEDSMPLTSLPNYFGITGEDGQYLISNIKNGTYKMFALLDMNQNYIFDQASEKIAFLNEAVVLDSSIGGVNFNLFSEENYNQFIIKEELEDYGRATFIFNKPLNNVEIILKDQVFPEDDYLQKLYYERDTLKIWFPDYEDKFTLIIKEDSIFSDTIAMEIEPVFSIDEMPPFSISPNLTGTVDLNKTLILNFENPITEWNAQFISLYEDSIQLNIKPFFKDSVKTNLVIPYKWKEKSKYFLQIGLGSFVDFYDQKNDVFELRFGAQDANFYGQLHINIDIGDTQAPYIFHLLDKELNVINERIVEGNMKVSYMYLRPDEYTFRLIQDINKNGKWDTGDYEEHLQPEPVIYYPSTTKVRSNWEMDLEWGIGIE